MDSPQITQVDPSKLKPATYNPRAWDQDAIENLRNSIEQFGLIDPIIANSAPARKNVVIGGHFRLKVAQDLGLKTVPVVFLNIPNEAREKELNLRLNRNQGSWDQNLLAKFDEELLLKIGFSPKELDDIIDLEPEEAESPEAVPQAPDKPRARLGDVYRLGAHRLMCGDATDPEHLARLLQGQTLDMVFTDPPYNVNYAGRGKNTGTGIKGDNVEADAFADFAGKVYANMATAMKDGAVYYVCSGWSSYPVFHSALAQAGFYRAGVIIWVKETGTFGWNDYRYKHEWIIVGKKKAQAKTGAVSILYGWKQGAHFFRDTRDEYDVWKVPRKASTAYAHPTEKPIWLIEKALANSSTRGQAIGDLFAGSGTTLIACERLGRRAYALELDPKYVDVTIARWERFTGQRAEKEPAPAKAVNNI